MTVVITMTKLVNVSPLIIHILVMEIDIFLFMASFTLT